MSDLSVSEKYPDSWRLDHPHFGDVQKTVYAKGVITEVEKTADNPIAFRSMVKVRVEGGDESDLIPIIFCPKDGYWDPSSLVFEESYKRHKKAWMSFRAGDEVIVMLRGDEDMGPLVPYCAMGFVDGVPRIGEDIVEFVASTVFRWQMSKAANYASEDGPDGMPLNLLKEAEIIEDELSPTTYGLGAIATQSDGTATLQTAITTRASYEIPGLYIEWDRTFKVYTHDMTTTATYKEWQYKYRHQTHLVTVGPTLYLIVTRWRSDYNLNVEEVGPVYQNPYTGWSLQCTIYDAMMWPGWIPFHFDNCAGDDGHITEDAEDYVATRSYSWTLDDPTRQEDPQYVSLLIYAAPYTQELYDELKANPPAVSDEPTLKLVTDPPPGFVKQTGQTSNIWLFTSYGENLRVNDEDGMIFNIRPHTKQELIAAGLWPEGVE